MQEVKVVQDVAVAAAVEVTRVARVEFEEPRLEKRGDLTEVTAGGFGSFSP